MHQPRPAELIENFFDTRRYDEPEDAYIRNDGLACFAMRYRGGVVGLKKGKDPLPLTKTSEKMFNGVVAERDISAMVYDYESFHRVEVHGEYGGLISAKTRVEDLTALNNTLYFTTRNGDKVQLHSLSEASDDDMFVRYTNHGDIQQYIKRGLGLDISNIFIAADNNQLYTFHRWETNKEYVLNELTPDKDGFKAKQLGVIDPSSSVTDMDIDRGQIYMATLASGESDTTIIKSAPIRKLKNKTDFVLTNSRGKALPGMFVRGLSVRTINDETLMAIAAETMVGLFRLK